METLISTPDEFCEKFHSFTLDLNELGKIRGGDDPPPPPPPPGGEEEYEEPIT